MANGKEINDIRRQMGQIRRELHEDIQGVVAGAEAVTDWRRYVRLYPWPSVAAAAVVGYLIVPKRRKSVTEVVEEVAPVSKKVVAAPTETKKEKRAGMVGTLFGLLMPIGVKVAQSYATNFLENWITQQGMAGAIPGFLPGGPDGPGGPTSPSPGGGPAPGHHSPGPSRPNPGPGPGPR